MTEPFSSFRNGWINMTAYYCHLEGITASCFLCIAHELRLIFAGAICLCLWTWWKVLFHEQRNMLQFCAILLIIIFFIEMHTNEMHQRQIEPKKPLANTHTHTHYIHQWFIDVRYFEADSKCYLCCCIQILMKALVWNMSTVFCGLSAMACLQFACVRFVLLITSQKSLRTNNKLEGETCDTEKCLSYIE